MNIIVSGNQQPMTPYHSYKSTRNFSSILNDMIKGQLPTGTGQPFPVNFNEEEEFTGPQSPWTQNTTSIVDPRPIGPSIFGL